MEHSLLRTVYDDALVLHRFDTAVLVECPVEQLERKRRHIQHSKRFQHCDVHHAVGQRGLRGDVGIVAILRCVGTGYQECFVADGTRRVLYFVCLRFIRQTFVQCIFQVGQQTSFPGIGKFQAHEGIESHSACTEEGVIVNDTVVYCLHISGIEHIDGSLRLHRNMKMACQSVARTTWNNPHRGIGMDKRPSYLIDGAVSADGYYDVRMFGGGLCGYLGSVTCIFCFPDRIIIYRMVQFFFNKSYDEFLSVSTGYGVYHKGDSLFCLHKPVSLKFGSTKIILSFIV